MAEAISAVDIRPGKCYNKTLNRGKSRKKGERCSIALGGGDMRSETKIVAPEVLVEEYRELLQDARIEALPLTVTGNSMSPFLVGGRDTVYLSRVTRPLRRGDAVLYQRRNGRYVFHRIYRVSEGSFTMTGDAQTVLEEGIEPDQIIAVMTRAERKGKILAPGSFWWEFFEKVWIRMIPLRGFLRRCYGRIRKIF